MHKQSKGTNMEQLNREQDGLWVFVIALARVARKRYDFNMLQCSRYHDSAWYAVGLTKIDNILTSDKISKTMKAIWTTLFHKGFFKNVDDSQGLGICLRLLFLEDVASSFLRPDLHDDGINLRERTSRELTAHYCKYLNTQIEGISTRVWKYSGADWLMHRVGLCKNTVSVFNPSISENYSTQVEIFEQQLTDLLLDKPERENRKTANRLLAIYQSCLQK